MPKPKLLTNRRRAWDVRSLDAAIDQFPIEGEQPEEDHSWSDVDAA